MKTKRPANFTQLETHSHYTLLRSTIPVADLVGRAAAEGMIHLALTDTNVLYGVLAFDKACRAAELQAIIGMTITVAGEGWKDTVAGGDTPGHLTLLATNDDPTVSLPPGEAFGYLYSRTREGVLVELRGDMRGAM